MLLVEQRQANIKAGPQLLPAHARLRQNRVPRIEAEAVLLVLRPRARIQIEQQMIAAAVPVRQPMQTRRHIAHVILAQCVPVQRIDAQHKDARSIRIVRVIAALRDRRNDLLVVETDGRRGRLADMRLGAARRRRIDVDEKLIVAAAEIEACLHATRGTVRFAARFRGGRRRQMRIGWLCAGPPKCVVVRRGGASAAGAAAGAAATVVRFIVVIVIGIEGIMHGIDERVGQIVHTANGDGAAGSMPSMLWIGATGDAMVSPIGGGARRER